MTAFNGYRNIVLVLALAVPTAMAAVDQDGANPGGVEQARQRLDELRSERGVYDPALIEAWSDLAARQAETGSHSEAAAAWQEALQVSRISDGLYDPAQLRIIEQLALAYEEAGEVEEADTYHHLLFHTRTRLAEPDSLETVDAIIAWSDWRLRRSTARDGGIYPGSLADTELQSLWDLQDEAFEVLASRQDDPGALPADPRYGTLLHLRSITGLGMASRIIQQPAYLMDPPLVDRYVTRRVCRNVTDSSGTTRRECYTQQVANPRYRQAQVAERSLQSQRAIRRVRDTLEQLETWQSNGSAAVVGPDELASLDRALTELERKTRRYRFSGW